MQIKEVMSKDVITVKRSTTLRELLRIFAKFHLFPLVPVVNEENYLEGIVSFRTLLNVFKPQHQELLKGVPFVEEEEDIFKVDFTEEVGSLVVVDDIMEKKFISISEDASLEEVFNLMKLHLKEELPVVDKAGKLAGKVGMFDIIRQVFRQKGVIN